MFGTGSYVTIKKVEEKALPSGSKYLEVKLTSSKKTKEGKYEMDFSDGFVKFVGKANNPDLKGGDVVKLLSCGVENCYKKDDKYEFLKQPRYTVFEYEYIRHYNDNEEEKEKKPAVKTVKEEELPF